MSDETLSADELATLRNYASGPGLVLLTATGPDEMAGDRDTVARLFAYIASLEAERDAAYARGMSARDVITPVIAPAINVDKTHCGFCVLSDKNLIEGPFVSICPECVRDCEDVLQARELAHRPQSETRRGG